MQITLRDGLSFLSDNDGEVKIMDNVKLETIRQGADRYNAALGQTSKHRIKEKRVVAKSLQKYEMFQENHPRKGFWPLQSSTIDHGRRFRCPNGALWLIRFFGTCFAGLNGCLSTLSAKVL